MRAQEVVRSGAVLSGQAAARLLILPYVVASTAEAPVRLSAAAAAAAHSLDRERDATSRSYVVGLLLVHTVGHSATAARPGLK